MELTDLNSIFELFCAFNFAYATHDGFSETINSKIITSFENILNNIEQNLIQKLRLNVETLSNINVINNDSIDTTPLFLKLDKQKVGIEDKIKIFIDEINAYKQTYYITKFFKFISLYSALFCITFLLFNSTTSFGFRVVNSDKINAKLLHLGCNEAFFTFSLISFIFLIFLMNMDLQIIKKLTLKTFSYVKTFFAFISISVISFIVYEICLHKKCYCSLDNLKLLIIIFSLIIPIAHFIVYLCRILYLSFRGEKKLWTKFHILNTEIDDYEKEVQDLVKVHDSIKMSIKNKTNM